MKGVTAERRAKETMLRKADDKDIAAIVEVYRSAFPDSVSRIFGGKTSNTPFIDLFRFLLDELPHYFLVDEERGRVVGYIIITPDASRLVLDAFLTGSVFVWAWHWLQRSYGFGLRPIWVLVSDKFALMRSQAAAPKTSRSRILSVAVDPREQGKGLGTKLSQAGMELLMGAGAKSVMLEVRDTNGPAMRIYEKLGFREVGRFADKQGCWIQMVAGLERAKERVA